MKKSSMFNDQCKKKLYNSTRFKGILTNFNFCRSTANDFWCLLRTLQDMHKNIFSSKMDQPILIMNIQCMQFLPEQQPLVQSTQLVQPHNNPTKINVQGDIKAHKWWSRKYASYYSWTTCLNQPVINIFCKIFNIEEFIRKLSNFEVISLFQKL